MSDTKYFVYRRNDGYVHAANGSRPRDYTAPGMEPTTFVILGEFEDWNVARSTIIANIAPATLRKSFGQDLPWEIRTQEILRDSADTVEARDAATAAIRALEAADVA